MRRTPALLGAIAALLGAAAVYWIWLRPPAVSPQPPGPVAPTPAPAPLPAPPAPPAASAPTAVEPAAPPASEAGAPPPTAMPPLPADDAGVRQALIDLLGREAVLQLLQTDGFAERIVATVDNLPRGHAAPRLWPVHPTPGRFTVDDRQRIALDNAERYGPFVRMVERLDPATAAAFYRRLQPQLQAAYEALGYPGHSFHARLMEVLDHLLATPAVAPPVAVTLTDVKGPIPSERPWVRYEYVDPALESRSVGQKILLRVGEVHQRRLMAWLRAFRAQVGAR